MVDHRCHARDCSAVVLPEKLMCGTHWRMVPRVLQEAVLQFYRPGQCDDKRPSRVWLYVARAAVEAVAETEARSGSRLAKKKRRTAAERVTSGDDDEVLW